MHPIVSAQIAQLRHEELLRAAAARRRLAAPRPAGWPRLGGPLVRAGERLEGWGRRLTRPHPTPASAPTPRVAR